MSFARNESPNMFVSALSVISTVHELSAAVHTHPMPSAARLVHAASPSRPPNPHVSAGTSIINDAPSSIPISVGSATGFVHFGVVCATSHRHAGSALHSPSFVFPSHRSMYRLATHMFECVAIAAFVSRCLEIVVIFSFPPPSFNDD